MKTKPKKFICVICETETYSDSYRCVFCDGEGFIKPIPKELYKCYLNGVFYGGGNLDYVHELFKDYVVDSKMYGKKECDFKIVRDI